MSSLNTISLESAVPKELTGLRFDQTLAVLFPDYSRSRLQSWIEEGKATVDGNILASKKKLHTGQVIKIEVVLKSETNWEPQSLSLNIIYKDESILIIDKPAGLVVHPGAGNPDQTLVNALLYDIPELKNLPRAGIVHRLDKDTTGLLVVARTLKAHTSLVEQIQARSVKREYFAIVQGTFGQWINKKEWTIEEPIGRDPKRRKQMAVVFSGKPAITHYQIAERFDKHTALHVFLETGRTHQIRVHMTHIGHPLVGDLVYKGRTKFPSKVSEDLKLAISHFKRQALHARKLALNHPETGERMEWESALPEDMNLLLSHLRGNKL